MPYGGDPQNSASDAVRMLMQDTSTSAPNLTDNEVDYLIAFHANAHYAAAAGAELIAGKNAESVVEKKIGDFSEKYATAPQGGIAGEYRALAATLREQAARAGVAPGVGGISISDKDSARDDTDWARSEIELGMHDINGSGLVDGSTSGRAFF